MYGYRMYENGAVNRYGNFDVEDPALYQTDVLREKAVRLDRGHRAGHSRSSSRSMSSPPHGESVDPARRPSRSSAPAPRDVGRYRHLRLPRRRTASATCATSRPTFASCTARAARRDARIRADFRSRRESLIAVDEAVEAGWRARAHGRRARLDLHPLHLGQRLLPGRAQHLQGQVPRLRPVLALPLLIRGPGIPAAPCRASSSPTPTSRRAPRGRRRHRRPAAGRALDAPVRPRRAPAHAPAGPARGLEAGDIDRDGGRASGTSSASYHAPPHRRATSTSSGSTAARALR